MVLLYVALLTKLLLTRSDTGRAGLRMLTERVTAAYKLKIVAEYEAAKPGIRGEVLRREGLYSSHLTEWRQARDTGALAGGLAATRGRPPADPVERDNERLRARNTQLEADLDTAQAAQQAAQQPIDLTQPDIAAYRIPGRLRRFIQARDRTCVFPGCTKDARGCDLDHRQPWPTGPTDGHNL